jgi:hypothetical protein
MQKFENCLRRRGCRYRCVELEMVSLTTITNIISLIQFALIPLNTANRQAEASEQSDVISTNVVHRFMSFDLGWLTKLFNAPLEFARRFLEIATPMRVLLFAAILFGLLNLLIVSLFLPAWRLLLFCTDLFLPGMGLFGILWIAEDYVEQRGTAVALLIIGLLYVLIRCGSMLVPYILKRNLNWELKAIHQISCIFLNRITQDIEPEELNHRAVAIREKVESQDNGLISLANPIREVGEKVEKALDPGQRRSMFIDIGISGGLALLCIILLAIGFNTLISATYEGVQGNTMADVSEIIVIAILVAAIIRGVVAGLYFFPRVRVYSLAFRRRCFQLIVVLSGITLLPILSMILRSTDTKTVTCAYMEFRDFKSNTSNFVDYFMARNTTCERCTSESIRTYQEDCGRVCMYNTSKLEYKVLKDAEQVNDDDLSRIYLIPINLLEVYFLAVFLQVERYIFTRILDILEMLPSPTQHVEAKFASLLEILTTSAGYLFQSYRHSQALFYFTFTQVKLFVLFFASLLPIFPVQEVKDIAMYVIPWMFFAVSIVIALTQIKVIPYVSILHNIVNGVGYFVGGIAAMLSALAVGGNDINQKLGNAFVILIFVSPIVSALIVPLFAKKDSRLKPVGYEPQKVLHAEERLCRLDGNENEGEDESSEVSSSLELDENPSDSKLGKKEKGGGPVQKSFLLMNYAPIHVQKGSVAANRGEMRKAKIIWRITDVDPTNVENATEEMIDLSDRVLDCLSFNSMVSLLNVSVIFVSACCGWGLGAGTAVWKKGTRATAAAIKYYLRCNMDVEGN